MFSPMVAIASAIAPATVQEPTGTVLTLQRLDVGLALFGGDQRDGLDQRLEFLVAGDEVGFRVHLDDDAGRAGGGDANEAFGGDAVRFLRSLG